MKINIGDLVIAEESNYIFAYEETEHYCPYLQIDTATFKVVDAYPVKQFEEDIKVGYKMHIGGKITHSIEHEELDL